MMSLELRHYGHKPIKRVRAASQESPRGYGKPCGFWVSVEGNGDGWREWCEAESFSGGWTHVYRVELAEGANVLHIGDVAALDAFHEEWSYIDIQHTAIDWRKVAKRYDGIIIAPYQYGRRLDGRVSDWYYGWDCASGCIWRPRAIASLTLTGEVYPRIREPELV